MSPFNAPPPDSVPAPFAPASLHDAIQQTLATAAPTIPAHHGIALITDARTGEHVAIATRLGKGWDLDVNAGYDWGGPMPGASARFTVGKTWG